MVRSPVGHGVHSSDVDNDKNSSNNENHMNSYFDLDGDRELIMSSGSEDSDILPPLTWRGDPNETLSDWTIIVVTDELQTLTFHVHKSIVVFGPRKSKLLARQFRASSKTSTSLSTNGNRNTNPFSVDSRSRSNSKSPIRRQFDRNGGNGIDYKNTNSNDSAKNLSYNRSSNSVYSVNDSPSFCPSTTKLELDQRDANNIPILLDFMYAVPTSSNGNYNSMSGETLTMCTSSLSNQLSMVSATSSNGGHNNILPSSSDLNSESNYSGLGEIICSQNAVSLRHLSRVFEVDHMMLAVNKFIQKDLNFHTGPLYLSKAHEYKDERLIFSAQRLCTENIDKIDKKALLKLPFHLFRSVVKSLESFQEENITLSLFLSDVVCRYLEMNPKSRSAEVLVDLTDPLVMPHIASDAAIGYTTLIKSLDPADAERHWTGLIRLARRCAKSVVREYGWSDFSVNAAVDEYLGNNLNKISKNNLNTCEDKENNHRIVVSNINTTSSKDQSSCSSSSNVESLLFATSFAAAVEQAQEDYEEIHSEQERLLGLVSALHDSLSAVERMMQQRSDQMERQQQALSSANETIAKLKAEIGEIRRQQLMQQQEQQIQQKQMQKQLHQQQLHKQTQLQQQQQQHKPLQRSNNNIYHHHHMNVSPSNSTSSTFNSVHTPPVPPQVFMKTSPLPPSNILSRSLVTSTNSKGLSNNMTSPTPPTATTAAATTIHRELVSPSRVGVDVYVNKQRSRDELRTRSEMRSRSLLQSLTLLSSP